jgi:hypothetical protein
VTDFLSEARSDLKAVLAGYKVHEYIPESINANSILIEPQDPYVVHGSSSNWDINFTLTYLVDTAVNKRVTAKADGVIVEIVERLRGEWTVQSVSVNLITFGEDENAVRFYAAVFNIKSTYNNL